MTGSQIVWHGQRAVRLESEVLTVIVLPERGAKIASITDSDGHEWLAQPPDGVLVAAEPGDCFVDAEMCGWDEMFPTLQSPGFPDHGEVWAAPWMVTSSDERSLETEIHGVIRGYLLRRRIHLTENGMTLRYAVIASDGPTEVMWVAHPQFVAPAGTTLSRPGGQCTVSATPDGPLDTAFGHNFDPIDGMARGSGRKLWFSADGRDGSMSLRHPGGETLTMRWETEDVAYLSVWIDNRWRAREPVVAIEPATGFGADLEAAAAAGRAMTLTTDTWRHWALHIDVTARQQS
ncbi:MAG: hypothetical protein ACOH10_03760 [Rhodoglobus sp.]